MSRTLRTMWSSSVTFMTPTILHLQVRFIEFHLSLWHKDDLLAVSANRFHLLQERLDFLRCPNGDSQAVFKTWCIKITHENLPPLEFLVQASKILPFSPRHYKVRLRRINLKAKPLEPAG